ncbi:MAG: hypothetical protein ACREMK_00625 [Gemmatimonadota bacterium]
MIDFRPPRSGTDPEAFRRTILRVFLMVALAVAFFQRLAAAQTADPAPAAPRPDPVPLEVGSTWTYEGQVWWIPWGFGRIYREQVTWMSEVTEVIRRGPWTAAMLEGHPYDLIRYERGRERGIYVLLVRDRKKAGPRVFLAGGRRAGNVWRRLQNREDTLKGLTMPTELILDLPLHGGKRFCPPARPATAAPEKRKKPVDDPAPVCWSVTDDGPADLRTVHGAEDIAADLFRVTARTPAEHAVWTFVPGLGFTSFAYGYSGEVSAVELHLVDYHVPSKIGDTALEH